MSDVASQERVVEAEPARGVDTPTANREDRARKSSYRRRFAVIYVVLALIAGIGIGALIVDGAARPGRRRRRPRLVRRGRPVGEPGERGHADRRPGPAQLPVPERRRARQRRSRAAHAHGTGTRATRSPCGLPDHPDTADGRPRRRTSMIVDSPRTRSSTRSAGAATQLRDPARDGRPRRVTCCSAAMAPRARAPHDEVRPGRRQRHGLPVRPAAGGRQSTASC